MALKFNIRVGNFIKNIIMFVSRYILLGIFLIPSGLASASPNNFILKKIESEYSGFNRNTNDVQIDKFNYAWIGSDNGLARFDGDHFFVFNSDSNENFFQNSKVEKLKLYDDLLYAVNFNDGLLTVNINNYNITRLLTEGVYDFTQHPKKNIIYVLTTDGKLKELVDGKLSRSVSVPLGLGLIEYHSNGIFLAIQNSGFYYLDEVNFELQDLSKLYGYPIPTGYREQLVKDRDSKLYYAREARLHVIDEDYSQVQILFPCGRSRSYIRIGDEFTVAGTQFKGSYLCDNTLIIAEDYQNVNNNINVEISANIDIRSYALIDSDSFLLTTNKGLFILRKENRFITSISDTHLNDRNIPRIRRAIVENHKNELLLFGFPEIFKLDKSKNLSHIETGNRNYYFDVTKLEDAIFATTEGAGIYKLDLDGNFIGRGEFSEGAYQHFYSILDFNEEFLIAGSRNFVSLISKDLLVRNDIALSSFTENYSQKDIVFDMALDSKGRGIWLAMNSGVSLISNDLSEELYYISSSGNSLVHLKNNSISAILQSVTGDTLWVGGNLGVDVINVTKGENLSFINHQNANLNSRVTALLYDVSGNLWISTYDGILVKNVHSEELVYLNSNNGLINQEFNLKSALITSAGEIVFGGLTGYDIINPEILVQRNFSNRVKLSKISFFTSDRVIDVVNSPDKIKNNLNITFRADTTSIRLFFSTLDIAQSSSYNFEYKLGNSPWMFMDSDKSITLSDLSYGSHKLSVRALNPFGQRFDNELQLMIFADTSFYYKPIFFLVMILVLVIMMVGLLYLLVSKYKQDIKIKEEIAMDLHDVIGTSLTRTTIQMQIGQESHNDIQKRVFQNLQEANYFLRNYISSISVRYFTSAEVISEIKDTIYQLLHESQIAFEFEESFKEKIRKKIPSQLVRDIKNSLYELCNNTKRHANANNVFICIRFSKEVIYIHFEDDGKLTNLDDLNKKGSYGLKNLKKRIVKYNGSTEYAVGKHGHGLLVKMEFKISRNNV
jgi:signal transduction histidine kinase